MLVDQASTKDQYIGKLKQRIEILEQQNNTDNQSTLQELQKKYKGLKEKYNELVDEFKYKE